MPVQIIISQIVMLGILVLIGVIASKVKVITPVSKDFLAKIIFNISLPAMVFTNFTKISVTDRLLANSLLFLVLSFIVLMIMLFVGWLTAHILKLKGGASGIFRIHSMLGNIMYLGFPVISALFGNEGLLYASIFALVSNILMWTVGVMTISSGHEGSFLKGMRHILNPNSIAVVAGFVLFLLSVRLPKVVLDPLTGLGAANTYLSMLYIGSVIFFASIRSMTRNFSIYMLSLNKLLIVPLLILALFLLIGPLLPVKIDPMVISVLVMQAAMPCMVNVVILVNYLGEDDSVATANVFLSTVLSIVTLPLILLSLRLLG
jgi:malate permease and related proteins